MNLFDAFFADDEEDIVTQHKVRGTCVAPLHHGKKHHVNTVTFADAQSVMSKHWQKQMLHGDGNKNLCCE